MRLTSLTVPLVLLAAALPAVASEQVDIDEWLVPYEATRPRDPFADSAGSVWFVGQRAGYLGHLDVASGAFRKIDLKDGSGPHNLIVGSDGIVWYAGNRTALIGRYDPGTGAIEEIPMPDPEARDPHTLIFDADEENIFFTVQGGNMMGRLHIDSRKVDLIPSPIERSRPYGIKLAADGTMWVALFGTNRLARIEPDSLELTIIELPRPETRPRRLVITGDGRVWYGDYAAGMLGVYDPVEDDFTEWALPQGEDARPYAMAVDSGGRIWVVATGVQPNQFTGFDPSSGTYFSETPVPSGGGTVRHMHYHQPSGTIWFGTDTNYIGRAVIEADR